jgi:hypothetical protein
VNQGIISPFLILHTDNGQRKLSLADGNCWTIGRGDDNQFVVKERCISRNHAMIQYTDAGVATVPLLMVAESAFPSPFTMGIRLPSVKQNLPFTALEPMAGWDWTQKAVSMAQSPRSSICGS